MLLEELEELELDELLLLLEELLDELLVFKELLLIEELDEDELLLDKEDEERLELEELEDDDSLLEEVSSIELLEKSTLLLGTEELLSTLNLKLQAVVHNANRVNALRKNFLFFIFN